MGLISKRDPLAVTVVSRNPVWTGMEYEMDYNRRHTPAPNVPPPTRRSSLAQTILIHRYQQSKYFSVLRYFGLRPDHPAAYGHKITPGAPTQRTSPTIIRPPGTGNFAHGSSTQGTMKPNPRWGKALPSRITPFSPPLYDTSQGG
jgi:hypothetical protein